MPALGSAVAALAAAARQAAFFSAFFLLLGAASATAAPAEGELVARLEAEVETFAEADPRRALASLDRALELNGRRNWPSPLPQLNDRTAKYLWRGMLHRKLGVSGEAEKDFREALRCALRAGNRRYQAEALNSLGAVSRDLGNFDQAQEAYEQALAVLKLLSEPQPELEIQLLRNLAGVCRILSNDAQADGLLESARQLAETKDDRVVRGLVLMDLAWSRQLAKDPHGALALYWPSFEAVSAFPPADQIVFFDRLATTLAGLRRPRDAWLAAEHALELARGSRNWSYEMRLSVNRCKLAAEFPELERPAGGGSYCDEAETQIRELRDTNLRANFLNYKSHQQRRDGRLAEAIAAAEQAAALADSLRFTVPGRNGRSRFLEGRSFIFRHLADLLMEAHRQDPAAGYDLRTLHVSERLKARSVLDLWSVAEVDFLAKVPARERRELEAKLSELDALEQVRGSQDTDARIAVLLADLDALGDRLLRQAPKGGWLPPAVFSLAGIQQRLDARTAIVLLLFGERRSYLFVIRASGPVRSYELAAPELLSRAAGRFMERLADPDSVFFPAATQEAGRELAGLLWGDREERLADLPEHLVFVGDGILQRLPLYALPRLDSPPGSPRELIDSHEVVFLPSLALLGRWAEREAALGRPTRNAVVFGDPFYQLDSHPPGTVVELDRRELQKNFPRASPGLRLGRLPFADLEAKSIAARFGRRPIDFALGPHASKAAALAPETGAYSIVHFASHGWRDPRHDELSSLLLSEVDERGRPVDGQLRLQDLYRVEPWRADLVVASACQTGVGDNLRLEGVGGIAQGFLQAGARRVMLSLWPVETETTAYLMDRFYDHLLAGLPPGAALRQASLDLRRLAKQRHKPWGSAYYWSPFILVGDWSSFVLPSEAGIPEQISVAGVH